MLFVKLMTLILTSITFNEVTIVGANVLTSRSLSKLLARDVPVCPQQPGYEAPPPSGLWSRRQQELSADQKANKGPGWRPSLCTKTYWVCVYIQKGVTYASAGKPGSGKVDATFLLDDGSTVQAIWYWQGTLQYVAPGGTVNIYPAHGTHWICVKGGMMVQIIGFSKFYYLGDKSDSSKLVCNCHWQPGKEFSSDNDLIIYPTSM